MFGGVTGMWLTGKVKWEGGVEGGRVCQSFRLKL
jgi:hypothetical protein